MGEFSWSEEKERLFRFESDVVVGASAGTGKTTALVELCLRLLQGETSYPLPVGLSNLLIITFTNKAADQLREKIGQALAKAGLFAPDERTMQLAAADIHTFHGFCARLLKEYAYEAGLSPQFAVAEPVSALRLAEQAIWEALRTAIEADSPLTKRLLVGHDLGELFRAQSELLQKEGGEPTPLFELEAETARLVTTRLEPGYKALARRIAALDEERRAPQKRLTENGAKAMSLVLEPFLKAFGERALPGPATPPGEGQAFFKALQQPLDAVAHSWPRHLSEERAALKEELGTVRAAFAAIKSLPDLRAFLLLGREVRAAYQAAKAKAGVLDFNDLEQRAIALLARNPELARSLAARFHVVMVDESQDTNGVQLRLLTHLRRTETNASGLPANRFLFVGDRKQSIYRFRGADLKAFRRLEDDLPQQAGQSLHFRENFRSSPALLSFYNGLFREVLQGGDPQESVSYGEGDDLQRPPQAPSETQQDEALPVELFVLKGEGGAAKRRQYEARRLVLRLMELLGPGGPSCVRDRKTGRLRRPQLGDCAILLRRKTHIGAYEQALREARLPYCVAQSMGFFLRREVRDLLVCARFLDNPYDLAARAALLRSPAVLLSDAALLWLFRQEPELWAADGARASRFGARCQAMPCAHEEERRSFLHALAAFDDWQGRLALLSPSQLIEEMAERLDLRAVALHDPQGARLTANQHKLVELARRFEAEEPGLGLHGFLTRFADAERLAAQEAEGVPEQDGESLTILTIHQAKGLEFPLVIVPDLSGAPYAPPSGIMIGRDGRLGMKLYIESEAERIDTLAYEQTKRAERLAEEAEYRRLLYVALTRARDYLLLAGDFQKPGNRAPTWLDLLLDHVARAQLGLRLVCDETEQSLGPLTPATETPGPTESVEALLAEEPARVGALSETDLGTFSVSALLDLERCERRFLLKRLLERSTSLWLPEEDEDDLRAESAAAPPESGAARGLLLHAFLKGREEPLGDVTEAEWNAYLTRLGYDPSTPAFSELLSALRRSKAAPDAWLATLQTAEFLREWAFLADIELPAGHRLKLKGRIDAFWRAADGRFFLLDYKTQTRQPQSAARYAAQLELYAVVLRQRQGAGTAASRAAIGYLLESAEPWQDVAIDDETLSRRLSSIERRLLRLYENDQRALPDWRVEAAAECPGQSCPFAAFCLEATPTCASPSPPERR